MRDGNAVVSFKNFNDTLHLPFPTVGTLLAPHCRNCLVEMLDYNLFVSFLFRSLLHATPTSRPIPPVCYLYKKYQIASSAPAIKTPIIMTACRASFEPASAITKTNSPTAAPNTTIDILVLP